jgi:hypothetical protein
MNNLQQTYGSAIDFVGERKLLTVTITVVLLCHGNSRLLNARKVYHSGPQHTGVLFRV